MRSGPQLHPSWAAAGRAEAAPGRWLPLARAGLVWSARAGTELRASAARGWSRTEVTGGAGAARWLATREGGRALPGLRALRPVARLLCAQSCGNRLGRQRPSLPRCAESRQAAAHPSPGGGQPQSPGAGAVTGFLFPFSFSLLCGCFHSFSLALSFFWSFPV